MKGPYGATPIRTFLSVAETLHFGRSAKLLYLSQPASSQIKFFE
ncbi:LysR family transcriptional regulator [Silvibacterium bohemicum]